MQGRHEYKVNLRRYQPRHDTFLVGVERALGAELAKATLIF